MVSLLTKGKRIWHTQRGVRFAAVGGFNTALDFVVLNIVFEFVGLPAVMSNIISASLGIVISYFLNHHIVFRHPYPYSAKAFIHFFLITGLSVLVVQSVVIFLVTSLWSPASGTVLHVASIDIKAATVELNVAKALAVVIGAVWNFLLYKYVVFRRKPKEPADEVLIV